MSYYNSIYFREEATPQNRKSKRQRSCFSSVRSRRITRGKRPSRARAISVKVGKEDDALVGGLYWLYLFITDAIPAVVETGWTFHILPIRECIIQRRWWVNILWPPHRRSKEKRHRRRRHDPAGKRRVTKLRNQYWHFREYQPFLIYPSSSRTGYRVD